MAFLHKTLKPKNQKRSFYFALKKNGVKNQMDFSLHLSEKLKTVTQSKQTATFLKQMLFLLFCFSHVYASTLLI